MWQEEYAELAHQFDVNSAARGPTLKLKLKLKLKLCNHTQYFHDITFIKTLIESISIIDCIYGLNTILPKSSTTK